MNRALLENASIEWRDGLPYSLQYQDIYFSREGGLEETRYTFIEGNQLLERWQTHSPPSFVLAEIGFGTGLNYLSTCLQWQSHAPDDKWLTYYSIEKHPLTLDDLVKSLSLWPELDQIKQTLIQRYPLPFEGVWTIQNQDLRIRLILLWMDAKDALDHLAHHSVNVDAWYLDGFAPSKNSDIWQDQRFQQIAQCSNQKTTFATYTAAGFVRRGLISCGFEVTKRQGFGIKREMLVGEFKATVRSKPPMNTAFHTSKTGSTSSRIYSQPKPWFKPPSVALSPKRIAVIGAGIAGVTTARKLADATATVTVFDENPLPAEGASGNSAGIYYPFLSTDLNHSTQFFLHAYFQLLHDIEQYDLHSMVQPIGVTKRLKDNKEYQKFLDTYSTNNELHRWIQLSESVQGTAINRNGDQRPTLTFPLSGYLSPKQICQSLIRHPNIQLLSNRRVDALSFNNGCWNLLSSDSSNQSTSETLSFDAVVLCNSFQAPRLLPPHFIPAITVRGQTCFIDQKHLGFEKPDRVWCEEVYSIPVETGLFVGATFELDNHRTELQGSSQIELMQKLQRFYGLHSTPNPPLNGRVGFRYCSVDRLPYVGPVATLTSSIQHYQTLWQGKSIQHYPDPEYWPNLYVNIAHGARGITSSFLCASLLESLILQTPSPLPLKLSSLVHPSRMLIKELKKPPNKRLAGVQHLIHSNQ